MVNTVNLTNEQNTNCQFCVSPVYQSLYKTYIHCFSLFIDCHRNVHGFARRPRRIEGRNPGFLYLFFQNIGWVPICLYNLYY